MLLTINDLLPHSTGVIVTAASTEYRVPTSSLSSSGSDQDTSSSNEHQLPTLTVSHMSSPASTLSSTTTTETDSNIVSGKELVMHLQAFVYGNIAIILRYGVKKSCFAKN